MVEKSKMLTLYRTMLKIRRFEESVSKLYAANEIPGFVHLYLGEEAVASGVCGALHSNDFITSTHRGHGHLIAKGGELNKMMAELFGKKTGYCQGKGGSMHIADPTLGILGANGIVGGGILIAVGAAYSAKVRGTEQVAVAFFGDGATNEGVFHEAMNMAAAWNLPVLFVCENNQFGVSTNYARVTRETDIAKRAVGYGVKSLTVDGNDVTQVYSKAKEMIALLRIGNGPALLVCNTWRHHGHFEGEGVTYWKKEELAAWKLKDPVQFARNYIISCRYASEEDLENIETAIAEDIRAAIEFARNSAFPDPADALKGLYAEEVTV